MLIPVTDYTNSSAIRAAVGITTEDIGDDVIADIKMDKILLSSLDDWLPTHAAVYAAGNVSTPTAQALKDLRNLQLYSQFYCASQIDIMQLAIANTISNGKDLLRRFEGIDFVDLSARLLARADIYRQKLEESVNLETGRTATTLIGSVAPTYDPVTNG